MKKITLTLIVLTLLAVSALTMSSPQGSKDPGNFTLYNTSGRLVSLDSFKGRVLLLSFFTTECPACQDEMPQLQGLYDKYRSRGLQVVGVNIRGSLEDVKLFAKNYKLTFPILLDEDGAVGHKYQVRYIPRIFIFDKSGKIIFKAQFMAAEELAQEIEKDLK